MKRHIYLFFLLSVLLYSCQNTEIDGLFDQSPEERFNAQLEQMKKELTEAPFGWTVYYQYKNLASENYFNIRFQENGQAVIDYPQAGGAVGTHTTTYTLRYTQQIDLVFDTYSIFSSLVGNQGGDFRFEFSKREDGKIYFNTRNDETEGAGVLQLSKTESANDYAELIALQAKMVDDSSKSFYRVLTLDNGEKYLLNVVSMNLAWLEYPLEGEIHREKCNLHITDDGFALEEPLQMNGVSVKRFVAKEDGSFEAWSDNAKVGILDYGTKPFKYPNSVAMLLEESGDYIYFAEQYSPTFTTLIDELRAADPLYTHIQFYLGADFIAYFRSNADIRWMQYLMEFEFAEDAIGMTFAYRVSAGANEYLDLAMKSFSQFHNHSFTVVPRDGLFYLVQDQNPAIWLILDPQ